MTGVNLFRWQLTAGSFRADRKAISDHSHCMCRNPWHSEGVMSPIHIGMTYPEGVGAGAKVGDIYPLTVDLSHVIVRTVHRYP